MMVEEVRERMSYTEARSWGVFFRMRNEEAQSGRPAVDEPAIEVDPRQLAAALGADVGGP